MAATKGRSVACIYPIDRLIPNKWGWIEDYAKVLPDKTELNV